MSALPSEIDDRSGPSVRAPDLLGNYIRVYTSA